MRQEEYTVAFVAQLLVKHNILDAHKARECINKAPIIQARLEKEQKERGASQRFIRYEVSPSEVVASMEMTALDGTAVDEDRIMELLAGHAGLPYRKIDPLKLDADLISETMTRPFAQRHVCLPLERRGMRLVMAIDNPYDLTLLHTLRDFTQHEIEQVVASKSDILKSITEIYGFKNAVKSANAELARGPDIGNLEQLVQLSNVNDLDGEDRHVIKAVEYIFHYAFDQRASDIHIEPKRQSSLIRMRIDGVLHDIYNLPRHVHLAVTSRIKMLSRMDISERRRPQDGRIKTERAGREVELRVSSMPVAFGEKIVIRIFDPEVVLQELSEVGFFEDELTLWHEFMNRRNGLVLVTGPTGSGKTTTLYSTLRKLADPRINITTIEDPIELIVEEFNQCLVQSRIGVTLASALRTVLRQDPDSVMCGAIRDAETAQMAVQAAMTGHLVFSTLHTNNAPSTINRMVDLGVEPFKLASVLVGVMAQRLLRKVCDHCRAETGLTTEQASMLDIKIPAGQDFNLPVHYGVGCVRCRNTGLFGRTGIFEVMKITSGVRRLIKQGGTAEELYAAARADGMRSLKESAVHKMARGMTSFEEVAFVLGETV